MPIHPRELCASNVSLRLLGLVLADESVDREGHREAGPGPERLLAGSETAHGVRGRGVDDGLDAVGEAMERAGADAEDGEDGGEEGEDGEELEDREREKIAHGRRWPGAG